MLFVARRITGVAAMSFSLVATFFGMGVPAGAVAAPPAVSVSFTWSPVVPVVGQVVTFSSTSTPSANNSIVQQRWDLDGDGQFNDGTAATVTTTFANPGDHTVQLHVVDKRGITYGRAETVTVAPLPVLNQLPVAAFDYYPDTPVSGEAVTFYSTATDPDSGVAAQRWDLDGDGTYGDALGPTAARHFSSPGSYTVGLQVVDTSGAASTVRRTIVVADRTSPTVLAALRPLFPSPVVRLAGTIMGTGIRVRGLTASAPKGTRTAVRCRGRSCPFRWRRYTHRSRGATGLVTVRRLSGRFLRAGSLLQVFVRRAGSIGRYTRFRVRRSKPPVRVDRCLVSLSRTPVSCALP